MTDSLNNNNQFSNNVEEESSFSLNDIWNMVWRYKWWYVLSTFICVCFAVLYLYRTPATFSRSAKVIIDDSSQDATMRSISQISGGMMGLRVGTVVLNEVQAFQSPDLMQMVVERLSLETTYVADRLLRNVEYYQNSPVEMKLLGGNVTKGFSYIFHGIDENNFVLKEFRIGPDEVKGEYKGRYGEPVESPAGSLAIFKTNHFDELDTEIRISWSNSMARAKGYCGRLNVSLSDKMSTVIILSIEDKFPSRAENILSTLLDAYNEVYIIQKNRAARNTSEFINERLVVIEKELGGIESNLKDYKEKNNLTDISAVAQTYLEQSSTYQARAFEVSNQLSIANFIRDYLNDPEHAMDLIPANLGLQSNTVDSQIGEYNDMVIQRDRLKGGSGVNNPMINDLTSALESLRTAILRSIDNLVATLKLQEDKVKSQEKQILARMASSSGQELELISIQRQQKVKESLYLYLLQKREENEIVSLVNVGNTRLIQNPNGSPYPVSPNKMMILLVALILGCAIPFGIIFLTYMFDTSVKSKNDLNVIKLPFLAEIPLVGAGTKTKIGLPKRIDRYDNNNCKIYVKSGRTDSINEAFRVLRTNLDLMIGKKSDHAKVIMLTSLLPNSGKTFILMNIAASMALKGAKVLAVDLDIRKASLSKSLRISNHGLTSYLNDGEGNIMDYVVKKAENLDVLPVGTIPPNPTELLSASRFADMFEALRAKYDYIFVDCPPVDIVADTSIIAAQCDMTMFVVRAGVVDKKHISEIERISLSGVYKRMCLVLNSVNIASRRYGSYGYGYGYGYGYDHAGSESTSKSISKRFSKRNK